METLLLILFLAAPFLLLAGLIAFLTIVIGNRTSRPSK
jgi:hypothetical protein